MRTNDELYDRAHAIQANKAMIGVLAGHSFSSNAMTPPPWFERFRWWERNAAYRRWYHHFKMWGERQGYVPDFVFLGEVP